MVICHSVPSQLLSSVFALLEQPCYPHFVSTRTVPPLQPVQNVSLQARKQALVRDAIWAAAIDLFAERGFEEITIDDIVARAGTSRRTFFRHFESKSDLMVQPVLSFGAALTSAIESCPSPCPPGKLFRHVVLDVAKRSVADPRLRKLMEIASKYPAAREAQISRVAAIQHQLAEAFLRHCTDEAMAHVLAGLTLAALSSAHRRWFIAGNIDIVPAVEHVLAQFSQIALGDRQSSRVRKVAEAAH